MAHPICKGTCQLDPEFRKKHKIPERKAPYGYKEHSLRSRPFIDEYRKGYRRCKECDIIFPPNPNPINRCPCCHCLTSRMPISSTSRRRYYNSLLGTKKLRPSTRIIIRSKGGIRVVH